MPRKGYIDNKGFYQLLKEYHIKKEKGETPEIPQKIFTNVDMIINRYVNVPKFKGYTFKDQMISEARLHSFKAINSFKYEKSENPLAYFTQCAHNAFIQIINKEKKETDVIKLLKIDYSIKDRQRERSILDKMKYTDQSLASINIPDKDDNFYPIKHYKNGKLFNTIKTKKELNDNILNMLITKHGEMDGQIKFEKIYKNI
jgi:hypothetical protein